MVKVIQPNIPPEWVPLFEKIFRWFQRRGVPIFARMWFQDARSIDRSKKKGSKIPLAGQAWSNLDGAVKTQWNYAAYNAYKFYSGYRLFTTDYIFRVMNNLSLPGTPANTHQLFGLKMFNPGGSANIFARRDDKDLIGQINFKFSFKKDEITPSGSQAFIVKCTAYYLIPGGIATETDTYTAPAGDSGWQTINRTFGTTDRKYFHFKIVFRINNYDAIIHLDNVILSDADGEFFRENWNTTNYDYWKPDMLYRKRDWQFHPAYIRNFFLHEYLE